MIMQVALKQLPYKHQMRNYRENCCLLGLDINLIIGNSLVLSDVIASSQPRQD